MIRKRPPTNSGALGSNAGSSRSKRQRITDGVKIFLDIAKESSDWLPPLKSALGGVNALIKHYEEFKDVREKIEDLTPLLERFKQAITTSAVDGDQAETKRRSELSRTLEDIDKQSQELLKRGTAAGFIDKGRDSGEVVKLVERLRDAINRYQISQQQAMYNQISNLTSSFDTLLKLHEKSPAVKNKLDLVMARVDRLCSENDEGSRDEHRREQRAKLFDALKLIRDDGRVLYNRIVAQGDEECQDDILAASEIAEDIREALLDYQMAQQRAIYDQNSRLIDAADLAVLNSCRRASGAGYRHGDRNGCLRGTRETVLNEIESWTKDFERSPVFWLNGLAGTGKSTIAQTVSERLFADGLLGASFFCSRDFKDRSDLHLIFPTLAFQLAHKYPTFRSVLVPLLRSNPDVVHESLYSQMEELIVGPLGSAGVPTVIVIDALDECTDDEPQSAILSVMGRLVGKLPEVKFFITGRPEPRIQSGFRLPLLEPLTDIFVLHNVEPTLINDDIKLFLKHKLSKLAQRYQLDGWPTDENIGLLCQRSAGLFVYAVATFKYLDNKFYLPNKRLKTIADFPDNTCHEGEASLDSLYLQILMEAFGVDDPAVFSKVRSIIGAVVLVANPLPPSGIAELVGLEIGEVLPFLTSIQSLLILDEDPTQPVRSFHKSFPDFITDPSRCTDTRFHISPRDLHLELATNCLRVMNDGLEQNLLSLPNYVLNSAVGDLQTRVDNRISAVLRYACQHWHNHLTESEGDFANAVSGLRSFLEENFLAWLEVLSVLGALREAAVSLQRLMVWLQKVAGDEQLLDITKDYFCFVTKFFEPISVSATHIYHSALELSPLSSIVRKLYHHRRLAPFPRVIVGTPDSWDPSIAVFIESDHNTPPTVWSPCSQFVAIQTERAVEIRDALTLGLLSTLQPIEPTSLLEGPPAYSPDGRSLACTSRTAIIIWDIQTGGVAKEVQCREICNEWVWSSDGRVISATGWEGADLVVYRHDVVSDTELPPITLGSWAKHFLWAHDESLRIMVAMWDRRIEAHTIKILEVGSTLTEIESFQLNWQLGILDEIISFSPATYQISTFDNGRIYEDSNGRISIWDIRDSYCSLLEERMSRISSFSSDGSLVANSSKEDIHIWKYENDRYIPWRQFPSPFPPRLSPSFSFSPTSSSVLNYSDNTLRLWRLDDASDTLTGTTCSRQLATTSLNVACVVTANRGEDIVTILDPNSWTPLQFIDTDIEIMAVVLTGNVLLVVSRQLIVAWPLGEDGLVGGTSGDGRAGRGDSIFTVPISWSCLDPTLFVGPEGEIAHIRSYWTSDRVYNTRTGRLSSGRLSPHGQSYSLKAIGRDGWFNQDDHSSGVDSLMSEWVGDYERRHMLWLPPEWRGTYCETDRFRAHSTIIRIYSRGGSIVIKFR